MNKEKIRILLAVAAVAIIWEWGQPILRDQGLAAFGNPAYEGLWIFLPHLLLYSTLGAVVAGIAWWALARAKAVPGPQLALSGGALGWGLLGGVVSVAVTVAFFQAAEMGGFKPAEFDPWRIGGNLFSNFYEEFVFRGFLLVSLTAVFGFWPAAVLTGLAFGFTHEQFPLPLQLFVSALGVFWAWIARQARSIWAAWVSHNVLDVVMDAILA